MENEEERKKNDDIEIKPNVVQMERGNNRKVLIRSGDQSKIYTMEVGETIRERINLLPGNRIF